MPTSYAFDCFLKEIKCHQERNNSYELELETRPIGNENEDKTRVYIGNERWMDKENFKTAVDIKPATGFVNNMARFIFGLETLRKSTVTGESSRRKRKENDDTNLEKPLKLPVDGIKTLRGCRN
ncbi:hypothetical protein KQX54_014334 [Cotesia glomerata]|uniref:Uncharacterized protein n=1 Tax=Cotesia glomerata TaxID=32391 RepID=A0AAV7IET1_COTGL|nr:hypothetical protein KQX54_014334 [Cotesia glomerata]